MTIGDRIVHYWPLLLVGLLALGGAMVVGALEQAPANAAATWLEIGKAGLQLAVTGVAVTLVSALVRAVDQRHQEARQRNDYILGQLHDVIRLYHEIKSVRRRLRAGGFQSSSSFAFTQEQDKTFDLLMNELNEAELSLEAVRRSAQDRLGLYDDGLEATLKLVDTYVGHVLDYWEIRSAPNPIPKHDPTEAWAALQAFLGDAYAKGGIKEGVSEPLKGIESAIRSRAVPIS